MYCVGKYIDCNLYYICSIIIIIITVLYLRSPGELYLGGIRGWVVKKIPHQRADVSSHFDGYCTQFGLSKHA